MSKVYIEQEAAIRNFCKGCGLFDTDNCICTGKVRCDEYDAILNTPPADVKPVVRCKECKHYRDKVQTSLGDAILYEYCTITGLPITSDFYCANSEKRANCGADMRKEAKDG